MPIQVIVAGGMFCWYTIFKKVARSFLKTNHCSNVHGGNIQEANQINIQ